MKVSRRDTLLAIKAIALIPDLSANDRRVAAALIDHYNRHTGRCDPGIRRLTKLLGVARRTVIRSIGVLASAGWLLKTRHGGRGNRNSYEPDWQRLLDFGLCWNAKMKSTGLRQMSPASLPEGQRRHLGGDASGTQTLVSNLTTETCWKGHPTEVTAQPHSSIGVRPPTTTATTHTTGSRSADVARAEAERRWSGDLHTQFASQPRTYGALVEAIDSDLRIAATNAELTKRGAGLLHILQQVRVGGA